MKNLDVHSHMLPENAIHQLSGETSPMDGENLYIINVAGQTIGPVTEGFFKLESRINEIDGLGIDSQIISPTFHLFLYREKTEVAERVARIQNDTIAEVCRSGSGRFFGNITLPLQNEKSALQELERAHSRLEMKGIEIGTNMCGHNLDDEVLFPIYERAQELGMPIFVHPNDFMARERLQKHLLEVVAGTLSETTVAVSSVLLGGVIEKFPHLKMIFCHGGGAIPYQIGRLKYALKILNQIKGSSINIDRELKNIYFDTVMFGPESLEFLINRNGKENTVLGTDYPFNVANWNSVRDLKALTSINESDKNLIAVENARGLFNL